MYSSRIIQAPKQCNIKYDITCKQIYTTIDQSINISLVKHKLSEGSLVQLKQLKNIIRQFHNLIKQQPNIIKISDPVIIVGDIHGQYQDLIKILALFSQQKISSQKFLNLKGTKKQTTFIFLGDYVDRGIMAVEVMTLLMLLKINNPKKAIMLRGNHQSRIMAELYNFKQECNQKYGQGVYELFMDAFDSLPLGCIVNQKYFCVHGGITDKLKTINEIQKIQRTKQIPLQGAYCDLIWSDPTPIFNGKIKSKTLFNNSRDCSIYYGVQLAQQFLRENKLSTIIRGHEVFAQGFKSYNWLNKQTPQTLTIFSAPNYCNTYGNRGAVMRIQNDKIKIRQYNQQVIQNNTLFNNNNNLQVFNWSINHITHTINGFVNCMMNRIAQLYIEELIDEPVGKQLEAFLSYYQKKGNINNNMNRTGQSFRFSLASNNGDNNQNNHNNNIKKNNMTQNKQKFLIKQIQSQQQSNNNNKFKNQQQKKQFLFKRSQQYYRQSHKIPKYNKFKKSNLQELKNKNTY